MIRNLVLILAGAALASQIPNLLRLDDKTALAPITASASSAAVPSAATVTPSGERIAVLDAGGGGHYSGNFRMDGKLVSGMIDTGATFVAINETTARKIGFSRSALDYRYAVSTANGPAEAAHVTVGRIEIGSVAVTDVEAYVLKDEALSSTLIGLSFLNKLKSYAVDSGRLRLVQ